MKMTRKLRNVFSSDAGFYRVFPTGEMGEGASPSTSVKFAHSPHLEKSPPAHSLFPHQIFIPWLLNNDFQVITQ